jgi:GNAT superfamily N-acetyltransferase
MSAPQIRPLDPASEEEIALVARRMRATLAEVVGAARGPEMFTLEWLMERVRWHLEPSRAAVFLAEHGGAIVGHTIVREQPWRGGPSGLFSTTYVAPEARRLGVARALLERGEAWMRERGLPSASTWTAAHNVKLIRLYEGRGYAVVETQSEGGDDMVRLGRSLSDSPLGEQGA